MESGLSIKWKTWFVDLFSRYIFIWALDTPIVPVSLNLIINFQLCLITNLYLTHLSAVSEGRAVGGYGVTTVLIYLAGAELLRKIRPVKKMNALMLIFKIYRTCSKEGSWRPRCNIGWLGLAELGLRPCGSWRPPSPSQGVSQSKSPSQRCCQEVRVTWSSSVDRVNGRDQ